MKLSNPGLPLLISLVAVLFFTACEKKEYQSIEELDEENIQAYINSNNLNVQEYVSEEGVKSGIYYEILAEGTGNDIDYAKRLPLVFTQKSLDGKFQSVDTFAVGNRYIDYFGYFPFGSAYAGQPGSPVEKEESIKMVIKKKLLKTNGKIRVIVPSRQLYGRNGDRNRGIPPNACIDFTVHVIDDVTVYEDQLIQAAILNAGYSVDEFTKNEDGVYYKILSPGNGDPIAIDTTINSQYILKRTDGHILEDNDEFKIKLNSSNFAVNAWLNMLPKIKKGGKIRFLAPSTQAYGLSGNSTGTIPPFLSLDFEVTVTDE